MYLALYRKWRPSTFDEVVGQKHITEILKSQVKSGRLSHAYIFIGTRGTGKTTCARILAKAVNCENPANGNPCGCCAACKGIADGSVLDVVELDAASNNGVDNVRALRDEAIFSPAQVKKRVYIVDEVHMLSTAAFNALLKILEEPPEHLMFILATTELQKVPATILSRCQRHTFKRIESNELSDYLCEIARRESFSLTRDAASLISRLAEGGVRDALSLLDQCSAYDTIDIDTVYSAMGLAGNRRIATLWDAVLRKDAEKALNEFKSLWMDGKDPGSLLSELSNLLRDVLVLRVAPQKGLELISGGNDTAVLKNFNKRMSTDELLSSMEALQAALAGLKTASNPRTAAELCILSLCNDTLSYSVSALRTRITKLEAMLEGGTVRFASVCEDNPGPETGRTPDTPALTEAYSKVTAGIPLQEKSVQHDGLQLEEEIRAATVNCVIPDEQTAETVPLRAETDREQAEKIVNAAKQYFGRGYRFVLDSKDVLFSFENGVLTAQAESGIYYDVLKRSESIRAFTAAAAEIGLHLSEVSVKELRPEDKPKRDILDIAKFPEVTVKK